jgi:thiamine biosynthesis lipoprotein
MAAAGDNVARSAAAFAHASVLRRAQPLLGTFVDISIASAPSSIADAAFNAAFWAVAQVHALMSFHDPASDVSRINRAASEESIAIHEWTFEVLQTAADLHRRSGGLFDVAVAPVLQAMGLLPESDGCAAPIGATATAAIELLPEGHVRLRQPGVRIDLGGIAKGFAVDRAVDALRSHGVGGGLVNAGGDLKAFGPEAQTIYIRDPRDPAALAAHIMVRDEGLATTGGRFDPFQSRDVRDCAVIDPRSGAPVRAVRGASVRAPCCMIADALTKIVMIAQEDAGSLLDHYGASAMLFASTGEVRATFDWQDSTYLAP